MLAKISQRKYGIRSTAAITEILKKAAIVKNTAAVNRMHTTSAALIFPSPKNRNGQIKFNINCMKNNVMAGILE